LTDRRIQKLASIILDYSTQVQPGERVAIRSSTLAEPLVSALYTQTLKRGGHPQLLLELPDHDRRLFDHANDAQLDFTPTFTRLAVEEFEVYIRIRSEADPRALNDVEPSRQNRWQKARSPILGAQLRRGADRSLKWLSTLFPTQGYAAQAGMALPDFEDFVYRACHVDDTTPDPVAHWQEVRKRQGAFTSRLEGHDQVKLRGPNVDLSLSIKGRHFLNASGMNNMPDGEVYTGPVENSVEGWVRYTYPAIYQGRVVEGVELHFEEGRVVKAVAGANQSFLLATLDTDPGARYVGEFAIGTNYQIDRFSGNILFDEKIGGTFHMAVGAGYPETGSQNKSAIHWDMICDLRTESEIEVDGEVIYRDGVFVD
jgi:aminopeptidase